MINEADKERERGRKWKTIAGNMLLLRVAGSRCLASSCWCWRLWLLDSDQEEEEEEDVSLRVGSSSSYLHLFLLLNYLSPQTTQSTESCHLLKPKRSFSINILLLYLLFSFPLLLLFLPSSLLSSSSTISLHKQPNL